MGFLPTNNKEMIERGWQQVDFVLVTGDAYIDHPSFGTAIISRVLEREGFKVGILSQPQWTSADAFREFGRPRLGFLINSGNVDSMVNHFSVFKKRRREDSYSPGGKPGKRPDRAVIVYSNRAKEAYKDIPVIIGGIEASLRRFAHYDYWDNKIRRSILLDSKADLLIYGMGERAIVEIAHGLNSDIPINEITWIKGTSYRFLGEANEIDKSETLILPQFNNICESKEDYCKSFKIQYENNDCYNGSNLAEPYGPKIWVIQNSPQEPLSTEELDGIYQLPYEYNYHPKYDAEGGVPAITEVRFSITSVRGCFGGCAFCALTYHQGRQVRGRSKESIINEAKKITKFSDFKGYIHDVGGPTANFRRAACKKQEKVGTCKNKDCLFPKPCENLVIDHSEYLDILKALRSIDQIKKVFIRSGIRYDYLLADNNKDFLNELVEHHISGTLKVAPEHISPKVLKLMRKPSKEVFLKFSSEYKKINNRLNKKQFLIPYLMSSHPGSTLEDAYELAVFLKETGFIPDQVQDFYPTPGTLSTCMYYTEMDPLTGDKIYVAKDIKEKMLQRGLLHFNKPENKKLVQEALKILGRKNI